MKDFEPQWTTTSLIHRQLKAIDYSVGFLSSLRLQETKARQLHLRVRAEDALASIQIEGGILTLERAFELSETFFAGENIGEVTESEREFLNYLHAFAQIDGLCGQGRNYRVSMHDVLNLHRVIVDGTRGGGQFAGVFRRESVVVGDRENGETLVHHEPPSWSEVEDEMRALTAWITRSTEKLPREKVMRCVENAEPDTWVHGAIVAGVAQHRTVWIHPFVDGNGRTARMFTTLLLWLRGYDFKCLFDLSTYYNRNRDDYYNALRATDQTGDYTIWLEYFLGGFSYQMMTISNQARDIAQGLSDIKE